jgi:hypothetical protein
MKIINFTQHRATEEQLEAGVLCPHTGGDEEYVKILKGLLTFDECPSIEDVESRAKELTRLATISADNWGIAIFMIGGAPFLMPALERHMKEAGLTPVYAFSKRESVEVVIDGATVKKSVFKHGGFIGITANDTFTQWYTSFNRTAQTIMDGNYTH